MGFQTQVRVSKRGFRFALGFQMRVLPYGGVSNWGERSKFGFQSRFSNDE